MAPFGPFLTPFEPFLTLSALYKPFLDHFGTKIGPFWGDFRPFLGRSGVTLGSLKDRFGIILGRFGVVLTPFWAVFGLCFDHFWAIFGPFLAVFFWPCLRSFCGFSVVQCNIKQNDARARQKYANFCQNSPK